MFGMVAANFVLATAQALNMILWLYMWIVIARAVISWVNPDPYNPIVRFLINATEPVLWRIRRVLPALGGLDLSPLVLLVAILFLQNFLVASLTDLGLSMR
jgi:YggT family protein